MKIWPQVKMVIELKNKNKNKKKKKIHFFCVGGILIKHGKSSRDEYDSQIGAYPMLSSVKYFIDIIFC